jgi:hypothetical protein
MFYPPDGLNRGDCCSKAVCTECYLQIRRPHPGPAGARCPFCNAQKYTARLRAPTDAERRRDEAEEQLVIEAQIRMRREGNGGAGGADTNEAAAAATPSPESGWVVVFFFFFFFFFEFSINP